MLPENVVQGSPEWFALRCGKVGASSIGDLMAKTRNGYGASRANLMARLVTERLTGTPAETYSSAAMQWGIETEPQARAAYAWRHDAEVTEVGWVPHPDIPEAGASPDGLVYNVAGTWAHGMVEIKCPNTATHIDTLLGSPIDRRYLLQMQWQMACADRHWCDFVSFDPRLPMRMQLFVQRVHRDEELIAEITNEVGIFLAELQQKVDDLNTRYPEEEAA